MKVLMINVVCGIRSTGRICTDLAVALEKYGHEVAIAYGREEVPKQFRKFAIRIGNDFDVNVHGIKARLIDGCGFGSKTTTEKFISWVREFDPDVIHLHNLHGYYLNIEVLLNYLRDCKKKIIWTLHDCWAFTGHSAYCDAINCTKWSTGCFSCPLTKEYPKSLVDNSKKNWERKKFLLDKIPQLTIVTPSFWLANMVKKSFLSCYPVEVIHNGIDTSIFHSSKNDFRSHYNLKNKFIVLGVATAWDDMKGLTDYFKLSNELDEKFKVVLVGLTERQMGLLPNNILGIQRTNSVDELAKIYTAADLFANFSYCENYPTVNLEALACGTPVVTYNTGGSPESAIQGKVIEKGDIISAANYIRKLGDNYSDKEEIKIDRNKIDISEMVNSYLNLYN